MSDYIFKTNEQVEKEHKEIMEKFNNMTKKDILKYIDENLNWNEDYCANYWEIYVDYE